MGSRIVASGNLCQIGREDTAFDIELQQHFVDAQARQKTDRVVKGFIVCDAYSWNAVQVWFCVRILPRTLLKSPFGGDACTKDKDTPEKVWMQALPSMGGFFSQCQGYSSTSSNRMITLLHPLIRLFLWMNGQNGRFRPQIGPILWMRGRECHRSRL